MPSTLNPLVVSVLRWKWAVPIISELWKHRGAKFVYLHHKLGISKSMLSETLKNLVHEGLVAKNPGYGHPLRPEYIIPAKCNTIAGQLAHLYNGLESNGLLDLLESKWFLPIIYALRTGPRRFGEIQAELGASNRALTISLKKLSEKSHVSREVGDGYPITVFYSLTVKNTDLNQILGLLETFE